MRPSKARILLTCLPKSGSTFVGKSLSDCLGIRTFSIHTSPEVQTLDAKRLKEVCKKGFCSQSHMLPTKPAIKLINENKIQVVVLERNLMDCMVSFVDFCNERVDTSEGVWENCMISQFGFYDKNFLNLSREAQIDYIIESSASWYLSFYIGWRKIADSLWQKPLFLTYEKLFSDLETEFLELVKNLNLYDEKLFAKFKFPAKESGSKGVRFNQGRSGRGQEELSDSQKDRLAKITATFESASQMQISEALL